MTTAAADTRDEVVERYFTHISDLRRGVEGSVDHLMELWDADGTFEFAGSPPVTGAFHGGVAIRTLYQNRFRQNNMSVLLDREGEALKGGEGKAAPARRASLGVVDTDVHRVRRMDDKLVAGWTTRIGTQDGRGFQVSGSHTFTFKNGKIASLRVVVSPKPDEAPGLALADLSVTDIGRLALAAWPVV